LGLGAASLAFLGALRRENPEAPRRPPPVAPVPPVPASPGPPAASASVYGDTPSVSSQADVAERMADRTPPPAAIPPYVPPPPAVSPSAADLRSFPHAAFLDRAAAFVLDVVLVLIAYQMLGIRGPGDERTYFLFLLLYHMGFWVWKGTTVGGIICNLRVIRTDGTSLQFVDALVRGLTAILSLVVLGLGALWILKDPERQAWHDKIAGTFVIKVPRSWPVG